MGEGERRIDGMAEGVCGGDGEDDDSSIIPSSFRMTSWNVDRGLSSERGIAREPILTSFLARSNDSFRFRSSSANSTWRWRLAFVSSEALV